MERITRFEVVEADEAYWNRKGSFPNEKIYLDTNSFEMKDGSLNSERDEFEELRAAQDHYSDIVNDCFIKSKFEQNMTIMLKKVEYEIDDEDDFLWYADDEVLEADLFYKGVHLSLKDTISIQEFQKITYENFKDYENYYTARIHKNIDGDEFEFTFERTGEYNKRFPSEPTEIDLCVNINKNDNWYDYKDFYQVDYFYLDDDEMTSFLSFELSKEEMKFIGEKLEFRD